MLLPPTCPVCRRPGRAPCAACESTLRPAPPLPAPPAVDACRAALAYDEGGRELVARLKYRNARSSVSWLARRMARLADRWLTTTAAPDPAWITWAPTTASRRRDRGFDQAELLARAVGRRLGLPCRPLLARGAGPHQTGRTLAERHSGPTFTAHRPAPPTVVLIDDVVTTGSTVSAAARALRSAGAERILVVAAARTPARRRHDTPAPKG
ncbi:MAG: ComF family protein [Acidimicrobiales bacterium]